ncbi:uroporphyrinogen-III synthase, partial [mine drainage metagenome]
MRNIPLTRIVYNQDPGTLKISVEAYAPSLVIVTSSIGANVFLSAGIVGDFAIMCIGRRTAEPFSALKRNVLVPGEENSMGLIDLVSHYTRDRTRIALCRSQKHNTELDEFLSSNGYDYRCFDLYDIEEVRSSNVVNEFMTENCRGIILTSSMEASVFASLAREV